MTVDTIQQITVQPIKPAEYQKLKHTIYEVINEAYRSDASWTTDKAFVAIDRIPANQEADFDARCIDPKNALLCAFDGDQIVGAIHILADQETTNEALLSCLSVSPTHQSRGVGSLLIRESIQYIRDHMSASIKEAVVHVFLARTELTSWYVRMGFKDVGQIVPFPYGDILIVDEAPLVILKHPIV